MIWIQYAIFGFGVGAIFALLASGIVLVYRSSGVLNFAHASMAMVCAYVNFDLIERAHLPVGLALLGAVAFGALLGTAVHRLVFVHVGRASQVVKLLASFGLAGVLQGAAALVWRTPGHPNSFGHSLFPIGSGIHVAGAAIPWQRVGLAVIGIVVCLGLAALVRYTEFGIQVRALAQNPLAAKLAGVNDRSIERRTWAIAGATAALAGVLIVPFGVLTPLSLSGFELKALAAALVGGFVSLPAALAGGVGLGIAQEVLVGAPAPLNGLRATLAAALIIGLLLLRVERFFVSEQEAKALEGDERLSTRTTARISLGAPARWLAGFAVAAVAALALTGFWAFVASRTLVYALLGLSLVVLTGWTGQVSLMPGTFAGVGACLAWILGTRFGYPLPLVLPLAALATIPVCALVGMAALRLRPLYLAVATVALAGLFEDTLFSQHWFANGGTAMTVTRPSWLRGDHAFAIASLVVTGLAFAATAAFGRTRTGRALRMTRDNDKAAAAGGVNPVKYRLLAFAISAFLSGLAGALLAYLLGTFSSAAFSFLVLSLAAFGLAAVGGLRAPLGALVGAAIFVFVTELLRSAVTSLNDWVSVAVGVGIIVTMAFSPDGLVGMGQTGLGRLRRLVGRQPETGVDVEVEVAGGT